MVAERGKIKRPSMCSEEEERGPREKVCRKKLVHWTEEETRTNKKKRVIQLEGQTSKYPNQI